MGSLFTNVATARRSRQAAQGPVIAISVCILLGCISNTWAWELLNSATKHGPPSTLVLYEHEDRVAPGKTVVTSASPSGDFSSIEFGTINVVSNILRAGIANDSAVLGKAQGLVTFEDDLSVALAFTFVVSTGSYSGSLTAQGVLDSSGNGEIVITGGTGDFRWARGYAKVLTVSTDPADVVFKNTLYLKYDD